VFATERGGLATCHEPGQLVGYVFVDVRRYGVRDLVCRLEGALIGWLGAAGVSAERRPGLPGVWVAGSDPPAKIGALGLHVGGGHSMHGFALNLVNDRRGFGLITPCGIEGAVVASVASVRAAAGDPVGTALRPERVAQAVGERVAAALDLTPGAIFDSPVPAEGT
jgi:lipoyl(octanoyl) transferase